MTVRYLRTRNRRDQPMTTDMDEFDENGPTGKVVVGSIIIEGSWVPIYEGDEPKPEVVDVIDFEPDYFTEWFNAQFKDQRLPIDIEAVKEYNEWVMTRKTAPEEPIVQIVDSDLPEGKKSSTFILEFDWNYGHEVEACKTKKAALERMAQWEETFIWAKFTNMKINSETRYQKEVSL